MMRRSPCYIYLLLLMASCCALLLFIGGPGSDSGRILKTAWELGHIVCFALWALLYGYWRRGGGWVRLLLEALVLAFVVGGAVELIQTRIGRDGSWADLGNDLLGSVTGVLVYLSFWRRERSWLLWPLRWIPATTSRSPRRVTNRSHTRGQAPFWQGPSWSRVR